MPCGELVDALDHRKRRRNVAISEILEECKLINAAAYGRMRSHGSQLGGEDQRITSKLPEKGLFAETITAKKRPFHAAVEYCESPHAIEVFGQVLGPLSIPVQQDFGVGMISPEVRTVVSELLPKFAKIVDLPVENNAERTVDRRHRLFSAGEIKNGEAPKSEIKANVWLDQVTIVVWATMDKTRGHSLQNGSFPLSEESGDAAHD